MIKRNNRALALCLALILSCSSLLAGCARWKEHYEQQQLMENLDPYEYLTSAYQNTKKATSLLFESRRTNRISGQIEQFFETVTEGMFSVDDSGTLVGYLLTTGQSDEEALDEKEHYFCGNRLYVYQNGSATYGERALAYHTESACLEPLMLRIMGVSDSFRNFAEALAERELAIKAEDGGVTLTLEEGIGEVLKLETYDDEGRYEDATGSLQLTVNKDGYLTGIHILLQSEWEGCTYDVDCAFALTPFEETKTVSEPDWVADAVKGEDLSDEPPELILHKQSVSLKQGEKFDIYSILSYSTECRMTMKNTNPIIGDLDNHGVFTAMLDGRTTVKITATQNGQTVTQVLKITVLEAAPKPTEPDTDTDFELTLNTNTVSIGTLEIFQLEATVSGRAQADILFVSNNEKVASVDKNGLIAGVGKGTTVISVIVVIGGSEYRADTVSVTVQ